MILIDGEIPLNQELLLKKAKIDGEIPPIDSKYSKMGVFAWHYRKISAYLPQNEFQTAFNRKTSAYFLRKVRIDSCGV